MTIENQAGEGSTPMVSFGDDAHFEIASPELLRGIAGGASPGIQAFPPNIGCGLDGGCGNVNVICTQGPGLPNIGCPDAEHHTNVVC